MSVFTPVSDAAMSDWLAGFAVGRLVSLKGIEAGVQNSNFFVTTGLGRYVLTLFESVPRADLPFYLNLMAHLARHGLPVPAPIADRSNEYLGSLSGKPAALVSRLAGSSVADPDAAQCARVGAMLAGLHLAGQSYGRKQENPRGAAWRAAAAAAVMPHLPVADAALLQEELAAQAALDALPLPTGVIHADLFRDNVLWDGEHIGGVLDFYFACHDTLLFDLAVTVNDWCANPDGGLDPARYAALVAAYHLDRPLEEAELAAWPLMLRRAALRFWLSRLEDFHLPRAGELVTVKDPAEFRAILLSRRTGVAPLPSFVGTPAIR
ncbi:homoserine kinase [Niveibacterium sp. SC-1]|uniref:homoserine kinase n=1 Tax=Niveibacterium sp. SC-1 TaxID=3135646 RepID=UPI00311E1277